MHATPNKVFNKWTRHLWARLLCTGWNSLFMKNFGQYSVHLLPFGMFHLDQTVYNWTLDLTMALCGTWHIAINAWEAWVLCADKMWSLSLAWRWAEAMTAVCRSDELSLPLWCCHVACDSIWLVHWQGFRSKTYSEGLRLILTTQVSLTCIQKTQSASVFTVCTHCSG